MTPDPEDARVVTVRTVLDRAESARAEAHRQMSQGRRPDAEDEPPTKETAATLKKELVRAEKEIERLTVSSARSEHARRQQSAELALARGELRRRTLEVEDLRRELGAVHAELQRQARFANEQAAELTALRERLSSRTVQQVQRVHAALRRLGISPKRIANLLYRR